MTKCIIIYIHNDKSAYEVREQILEMLRKIYSTWSEEFLQVETENCASKYYNPRIIFAKPDC